MLHKYTQAEYDAILRDENEDKHCPTGDYTDVDFHGETWVIFGDRCTLGDCCTLGDYCTLGNDCTLGNHCKLGNGCTLGNHCKLGNGCTLGNHCKLGYFCTLGDFCKLGNCITYEGGRVKNGLYITCGAIGSDSRTAYAYIDCDGAMYVRDGCWFGELDGLRERVKRVHAGRIYELQYLAMCDYAERILPAMLADRDRRRAQ